MIESVKFQLHETFRNPERIVKKSPFELCTKGWGTFYLPITINWKKKFNLGPTHYEHYLSFTGDGKWKSETKYL